jgi:hypothetical protein
VVLLLHHISFGINMNMMYNFLVEENERLRKQIGQIFLEREELLEFVNVVQVSTSHLIQDGEGNDTIKNLLSLAEEIQNKHGNKT